MCIRDRFRAGRPAHLGDLARKEKNIMRKTEVLMNHKLHFQITTHLAHFSSLQPISFCFRKKCFKYHLSIIYVVLCTKSSTFHSAMKQNSIKLIPLLQTSSNRPRTKKTMYYYRRNRTVKYLHVQILQKMCFSATNQSPNHSCHAVLFNSTFLYSYISKVSLSTNTMIILTDSENVLR